VKFDPVSAEKIKGQSLPQIVQTIASTPLQHPHNSNHNRSPLVSGLHLDPPELRP